MSSDSQEWFLDFGCDSITLNVKYLVREMTKSPKKIPAENAGNDGGSSLYRWGTAYGSQWL